MHKDNQFIGNMQIFNNLIYNQFKHFLFCEFLLSFLFPCND